MKPFIKNIIHRLRYLVDLVMAPFALPSALVLRLFRAIGASRLPLTRKTIIWAGVFPIRDHYYEPLFNPKQLSKELDMDRELPGLNLNEQKQLELLSKLNHSDELVDLKLSKKPMGVTDFCMENGSFESGDAEFLYQFIRHIRPKKVIEIGSGNSTKIAKMALDRNRQDSEIPSQHLCIEPYEMPWLEKLGVKVVRKKVEDCALSQFQELEAGDLLFIDSSHVIRPQGDVLHEYLTILPKLRKGVYVHIHDIFTPKDYLKRWIREDVRFWNEQYLLEALLTDSTRYEVIAALNFLHHHHLLRLQEVCPYLKPEREPGSFYLKIC